MTGFTVEPGDIKKSVWGQLIASSRENKEISAKLYNKIVIWVTLRLKLISVKYQIHSLQTSPNRNLRYQNVSTDVHVRYQLEPRNFVKCITILPGIDRCVCIHCTRSLLSKATFKICVINCFGFSILGRILNWNPFL